MNYLISARHSYGRLFAVIGSCLFVPALLLYMIWTQTHSETLLAVYTLMGVFGLVWLALSMFFIRAARREMEKLGRLKEFGVRYDAKIDDIEISKQPIKAKSMISARAQCSYLNDEGKICKVQSQPFIITQTNAQYEAAVYINRSKPSDYAVELMMKIPTE